MKLTPSAVDILISGMEQLSIDAGSPNHFNMNRSVVFTVFFFKCFPLKV